MARRQHPQSYIETLRFRGGSLWVFVSGCFLAAMAGWFARHRETESARAHFRQRADVVVQGVKRNFDLSLEALRATSALLRAHPRVTADQFQRFARELMSRHTSLAALEWAPLVPYAEQKTFEAARTLETGRPFSIREPGEAGAMHAVPARDRYAPLVFLEPFLLDLEGLDIRFETTRRAAVDTAVTSRHLFATAKFRLVEDPPGVFSVAVYDPVPASSDASAPIAGVAIALYRLDPLVRGALSGTDLRTVDFALLDDTETDPKERILFASRAGAESPPDTHTVYRKQFGFVGRQWSAICATHLEVPWGTALLVFGAGAAVSALVAWLLAAREGRRRLELALRAEHELGGYVLKKQLGAGGMGSVFEATHRLLRRRVAIKLVSPERNLPELTERFNREARTMADLSSPHTITLYDYGAASDGRLYVVMEYLDGMTLETLVSKFGAQKPERVRHLLLEVCDSLIEAHEAGIIHRDIKPANIMLCKVGGRHDFVKVLDFGLAKSTLSTETKLSRSGIVLGTFTHLAPECLGDSAAASARSDLYSLGCVAYELLSGREVFASVDQTALISAHLTRAPEPLDPALVPAEFERIVLKCLEKDPARRFQSARQLARALKNIDLPAWTEADAAEWWHAFGQSASDQRSQNAAGATA